MGELLQQLAGLIKNPAVVASLLSGSAVIAVVRWFYEKQHAFIRERLDLLDKENADIRRRNEELKEIAATAKEENKRLREVAGDLGRVVEQLRQEPLLTRQHLEELREATKAVQSLPSSTLRILERSSILSADLVSAQEEGFSRLEQAIRESPGSRELIDVLQRTLGLIADAHSTAGGEAEALKEELRRLGRGH
jgi:hypothetical protein